MPTSDSTFFPVIAIVPFLILTKDDRPRADFGKVVAVSKEIQLYL